MTYHFATLSISWILLYFLTTWNYDVMSGLTIIIIIISMIMTITIRSSISPVFPVVIIAVKYRAIGRGAVKVVYPNWVIWSCVAMSVYSRLATNIKLMVYAFLMIQIQAKYKIKFYIMLKSNSILVFMNEWIR